MKSESTRWWLHASVATIIWTAAFACSSQLRADKICDCESPPGGQIRCEDNQIPFCIVKDGRVFGVCRTPPVSQNRGNELRAWVLSQVTGVETKAQEVQNNAAKKQILDAGSFTNPRTREVITFKLSKGNGQ